VSKSKIKAQRGNDLFYVSLVSQVIQKEFFTNDLFDS
jgi:hypothetical protein